MENERLAELVEEIHNGAPEKGYRRIRGELDRYHGMAANDKRILRICRIILIDHGRIAEEGTHEDLMKRNGLYAKLFEVQSRYYQEGRQWNEEET